MAKNAAKPPDNREPILFRVDPETKDWLEDLAKASGYPTLQDFMVDAAKSLIRNADPRVYRTAKEIHDRRKTKVQPSVELPKAVSGRVAENPVSK